MSEPHAISRIVELRYGHTVDLAEVNGLDHLFGAIIGETMRMVRLVRKNTNHHTTPAEIYSECLFEVHYIAGQLRAMRSSLTLDLLMSEFPAHWDSLADRVNSSK